MSEFEKKKVDLELRHFAAKHFVSPAKCNSEQVRSCIKELATRIDALENRCGYVPEWAYSMLAHYNARQNSFLLVDFKASYY